MTSENLAGSHFLMQVVSAGAERAVERLAHFGLGKGISDFGVTSGHPASSDVMPSNTSPSSIALALDASVAREDENPAATTECVEHDECAQCARSENRVHSNKGAARVCSKVFWKLNINVCILNMRMSSPR